MTRHIKFHVGDRVRVLRPSPRGGEYGFVEQIDDTARDPYLVRFDDNGVEIYAGDELTFDAVATGNEFIDRVAKLSMDPDVAAAFDNALEVRRRDSFDSYQASTRETAIYPQELALLYLALGLASESGEVAGKVKKAVRDGHSVNITDVLAELGDVLWYTARLVDELGSSLSDVAQDNLAKLEDRKARGVVGGSGDNR